MTNTQISNKNPRKVRLIGKGTGWEQAPDNDEFENWGLNGLIFQQKRLDRIFMMDIIDEMPSVLSGMWTVENVVNRINELSVPLVAPVRYEEIPTSERFPLEEAAREFGQPYFNNTIAYMVCYALLRGVEEIQLFGINQASGTEYFYEKGCVEYWLGIATGMGVRVAIYGKDSELLKNKQRYGGDRLYGFNATYNAIIKAEERFGEAVVRNLTQPQVDEAVVRLDTTRGLRSSDVLGIRQIWNQFKNHPEGKWILGLHDAYNVARFLVDEKPKKILDLGTGIGCSAAVMRFAAEEDAEITSVDQFEKCTSIASDLVAGVNFIQRDPEVFSFDGVPHQRLSGYRDLPEGKWDFVLIDGPGEFLVDDEVTKYPNGDIFRIVDQVKEGGIVYVDGREDTVKLIRRFLTPFFDIAHMGREFSVFKRTKQKFVQELMVDQLKERFKQENYFN